MAHLARLWSDGALTSLLHLRLCSCIVLIPANSILLDVLLHHLGGWLPLERLLGQVLEIVH